METIKKQYLNFLNDVSMQVRKNRKLFNEFGEKAKTISNYIDKFDAEGFKVVTTSGKTQDKKFDNGIRIINNDDYKSMIVYWKFIVGVFVNDSNRHLIPKTVEFNSDDADLAISKLIKERIFNDGVKKYLNLNKDIIWIIDSLVDSANKEDVLHYLDYTEEELDILFKTDIETEEELQLMKDTIKEERNDINDFLRLNTRYIESVIDIDYLLCEMDNFIYSMQNNYLF